ncbi:MAG TPA: PsbP-related protein [Nitrososphaeraceae archaeon]|nr:PsbP-related protein [Nitrososphaeraceae archaeon]
MTSILDEINRSSLSIALSVSAIFSIFLIIDHIEHNMAFALFHENPIIPISVESEFRTYDDIITGFSIKYPYDWDSAQDIDKSVAFHAPKEGNSDTNPADLGIMAIEVGSNTTLSTITQNQLNTLKKLYPDFQAQESVETIFVGHPAHKIIFTATDNTQNVRKAMQIWFKEDTKAFLVTYKSDNERFSKYLPTIDRMLNTFYTYKN